MMPTSVFLLLSVLVIARGLRAQPGAEPCAPSSPPAGRGSVGGVVQGQLPREAHAGTLLVLRNADDTRNIAFTHADDQACYRFFAPPGHYIVRADVTGDQGFREADVVSGSAAVADFHINDTIVTMSIEVRDRKGNLFLDFVEYTARPDGMPPDHVAGTLRGKGFVEQVTSDSGLGTLRLSAPPGDYRLKIHARGFKTTTIPIAITEDLGAGSRVLRSR